MSKSANTSQDREIERNRERGAGIIKTKKKNQNKMFPNLTAAETNPIIRVSCCKFVLMVEVRK